MTSTFRATSSAASLGSRSSSSSAERNSKRRFWPSTYPDLRSASRSSVRSEKPVITVHKDPTCGCCSGWVQHLHDAGFITKMLDTSDIDAVKKRLGVPDDLAACHTGCPDQAQELAAPRPHAVARGGQEAVASQRP